MFAEYLKFQLYKLFTRILSGPNPISEVKQFQAPSILLTYDGDVDTESVAKYSDATFFKFLESAYRQKIEPNLIGCILALRVA